MNTCKTCAHWIDPNDCPDDEYRAESLCHPWDVDVDEPMKLTIEVRMCKHPAQTFSERPVEVDGFGVVDGSNFYARLVTAENFGCVRHATQAQ